MKAFSGQLNLQIAAEFANEAQSLASAIYYDQDAMPQLASVFYARAIRQRRVALRSLRYLVKTSQPALVPGVDQPKAQFDRLTQPIDLAIRADRTSLKQVESLYQMARAEADFASEQFVQWFLVAKQAELADLSELLVLVSRNEDRVHAIEKHLSRDGARGVLGAVAPVRVGAR